MSTYRIHFLFFSFVHSKDLGLFGEMGNNRGGEGKLQNDLVHLVCQKLRKFSKNNDVVPKDTDPRLKLLLLADLGQFE